MDNLLFMALTLDNVTRCRTIKKRDFIMNKLAVEEVRHVGRAFFHFQLE